MDGGANKSGIETKSFNRLFKLFIILALTVGFTTLIATIFAVQLFSNRALPNTMVAGSNIGNLSGSELNEKFDSLIQDLEVRKFKLGNSQTSLKELSIKIDKDNARDQIVIGKTNDYTNKVKRLFSALVGKPNLVNLKLSSNEYSIQEIGKLAKEFEIQPKNAQYSVYNEELKIIEDTSGKVLNSINTIENIADAFEKNNNTVEIHFDAKVADVTKADLELSYAKAKLVVEDGVEIIHNSQIFNLDGKEILAWIDIINGTNNNIVFNEATIIKSLNKIATNLDIDPQSELISEDGQIIQKGVNGLKIDTEKAITDIMSLLTSRANNQSTDNKIILNTTATKFSTETINRNTTPGLYKGKYIEVDISSQTLYQYVGKKLVGKHKISSGKRSTPTPIGKFKINSKHPRAYSSRYGLYMPYWMAFIGSKYGLHELPEWPGGYKEGQNHLGIPVSHGCVRLGVGSAKKVYNWAPVGTPVVIHF